jgi:hypothetical protein
MMNKRFLYFLGTIYLFSGVLLAACQPAKVLSVTGLISQPDKYNGKEITVEGYYFSGFEISALAGELAAANYKPGNLVPQAPLIWLTGDLGPGVYNQLYQQADTPSGYDERYGMVRVTGIFQYGGKYGHMNAYPYLLTVSTGTLLPWSPPK